MYAAGILLNDNTVITTVTTSMQLPDCYSVSIHAGVYSIHGMHV